MSYFKTHLKLAMAGLLAIAVNAPASMILVHFGGAALPDIGWNSITLGDIGVPIDLVDNTGTATGYTITKQVEFRFNNDAGYSGGNVGDFIAAAVSTSLFGDNEAPYQSLLIAGLDTNHTYTFEIFASRSGVHPVSDNRSSLYSFTGANSGEAELNGSGNISNLAVIEAIQPDPGGAILFEITSAPSNNNASGWYYINAMKITGTSLSDPDPEDETWAGYEVVDGWVDTGAWLGLLYVGHGNWVYMNQPGNWVYLPESHVQAN